TLVSVLGKHLVRSDAKVWEGYLVLLTPAFVPVDSQTEAAALRSDTQHVRKLLATGEHLRELADVEGALLPLLPLPLPPERVTASSALDMLPQLLEKRNIRRKDVEVVTEAFAAQESIIERLHQQLGGNGQCK
ncbi:hypothetical protein LCGC14_3096200, partial [marine sediment metagenome]